MQDIVKSVSITNLLQRRAATLARLTDAVRLLKEAGAAAGSMLSCPGFEVRACGDLCNERLSATDIEERLRREVDASGWQYLMRESGLRTLMDKTARAKWDEKICKGDVPPLTAENIEATFQTLHETRAEMFERGILEVFRQLSWEYKTNTPIKFGKKIIMTYFCERFPHSRGFYFKRAACDKLDDLVRVFYVLDGKPEPDHRDSVSGRLDVVDRDGQQELDSEYLHVRWFKAGTGHITFKRMDVVDKMNDVLAKHFPNALAARI